MLTRFVEISHPDADLARKARWLNRVLLSFVITGLIASVGMLLAFPFSAQIAISFIVVAALTGLYALSRRGMVTLSLVGLLVLLTAGILQAGLVLPNVGTLSYPALFVLVIITVGVFLSARVVFVAVGCVGIVTIWYYQYSSAPGVVLFRTQNPEALTLFMYTLLILFIAAGGLSWLSSRMMDETLSTLRRRASELEAAYRELAEQSEREHALGTNIGTLATRLSGVSSRQVQGVGTQARSITNVVTAVSELHAAANQIAAITQEVRGAAVAALDSVSRAQELVAHSREVVQRNRAQVQTVIDRMTALDQLTGRISTFIDGIRDLSDETQLLALNATIEAAGAGALGRRFGVVAGEVQNLSRRSNEFVEQIRLALNDLRRAGQTALAASQGGLAVADEVQQVADEVRVAQGQIVEAVEQTNGLIHQISAATIQQNTATEQVTQIMQQIATDADSTIQETHALEAVSSELLRASELLMSAMARLQPVLPTWQPDAPAPPSPGGRLVPAPPIGG
jgi:methyl-accepting chemotaxis protein